MACLFRIVFYAPDQQTADRAAEAVFRRVDDLENVMSDYDPRSELSTLCKQPAGVPVLLSQDLYHILEKSQELSARSHGAFDCTLGPLIQKWRQSRKTKKLPAPSEIEGARQRCGYDKLILNARNRTATLAVPGMQLDLGGIGKGFTADEALKILRQRGLNRAMVAASGDIAIGDPPPGEKGWLIDIQNLDSKSKGPSRCVRLHNAGISSSGDTEQYVEINGARYSHIIDPKTGLGLTHRIGTTVIARNATTTDTLDTTLCILGLSDGIRLLKQYPGSSALIVELTEQGTIKETTTPAMRKMLDEGLRESSIKN
jgi:thiamine biosynthesis lipoprotein